MRPCVIMPLRDYEDIRIHIQHSINILENKRVSVKDRLSVLDSLYAIRNALDDDKTDVEEFLDDKFKRFADAIDRRIDAAILD